jgi:hypothetical protein
MTADPTPTAPGLDAEDREALARVVADHRILWGTAMAGSWYADCSCYEWHATRPTGGEVQAGHDAHLADAILAAGWRSPEQVAAAKAEAWDDCARESCDLGWLHDWALSDLLVRNPYRAAGNPSAPICGPSSPEAGADASDAERATERGGER